MLPKLSPPNPSRLLARPRLHQRLDEGCRSVVWITAPAGAGKTSLVAGWSRTRSEPLCWARVDRADRDPATFFRAMAQAITTRDRPRLPVFEPEHFLDLGGFTQRYLRTWYGALDPRTLIVLDNLHEAAEPTGEPAWFLAALVLERPPEVTLVLSSRQAPDGPLLPLTLDPEHIRLDYGDLRCRDEEAEQLAGRLGLAAPDAALLARADGWMAGVSLLLRTGSDPADRRPARDHDASNGESALFATFASQAFEALPATSQDLLLTHAFSPCIRPEAADRLLGVDGSKRALQSLWQAQFFVERRIGPDGRTDFVCHPLLRAFLQNRVRQRWSPASLVALCQRQAEAFEASGEHEAAIGLWLQAGDRAAVVRLLLTEAAEMLAQGHHGAWLDWLNRLGDVPPAHRAALAYWEGKFLRMRAPARAIACQQRAREAWLADGHLEGQLLAVCAILEAFFARWKDWDAALPWIDEAQRLYQALTAEAGESIGPVGARFAGSDAEYEAIASGYGVTLMHPGHPLLAIWYTRACELLRHASWGEPQLALSSFVMCHAWWHGHFHTLREVSRQALHAIRSGTDRLGVQLTPLLWVVTAGNVDGKACDAERKAAAGLLVARCERSGIRALRHHAWMRALHGAFTRRDLRSGDLARARIEALDTNRPAGRGLTLISMLAHEQLKGNWPLVIEQSEFLLAHDPAIRDWLFGGHVVRLELAQVLAEVGDHERAAYWARDVLAFARRHDSPGLELLAVLVLAAGEIARGRLDQGDDLLRRGLSLARIQGHLALPCAPPGYMATLAARALAADIEPAWVRQLIRDQQLPALAPSLPRWPYRVRIEVLGPFRLIVDGVIQTRQGRAQQRVLELLKALAAEGGLAVNGQALANRIWQDSDGAAALAALDIALHRARRLLGDSACLLLKDGQLSLNPAFVDLDLWPVRQAFEKIDAVTASLTGDDRSAVEPAADAVATTVELARNLSRDYPATLLAGEREKAWVLEARQAWRRRLEAAAGSLARACLSCGRIPLALDLIERALEEHPGSPDLMRLHADAVERFGPLPGWQSPGGPA